MNIRVGRDIEVFNPIPEIIEYCQSELIIPNPEYEKKEQMGFWLGDTPRALYLYSTRDGAYVLPFGCLRDVFRIAKESGKQYSYVTKFPEFKRVIIGTPPSLYDYQERAVEDMDKSKQGVLQAPCGSGKTRMGLALIQRVGGRSLWLTHTSKLLVQSMASARILFPRCSMSTVTEGKADLSGKIVFATVQTMSHVDPSLYRDYFSMVVVDECHHCAGTPTKFTMFSKVVVNCNCRRKYGLSATPKRADGLTKAMLAIIGPIVHVVTEEEVGDKIIRAEHYRMPVTIPRKVSEYSMGDGVLNFNILIDSLTQDPRRDEVIARSVANIYQIKHGKQLLLTARVEHVKALAKAIREKGMEVSEVYGAIKQKDRKDAFSSPIIVATYSLAKEGLDVPSLSVLHLCTPVKDYATIVQCAGRVERNFPGKETPVILDYVDTAIPYCERAFKIRKRYLKRR